MPKVAAVLGLLRGAGSGSAGGAETILQAVAAKIANAAHTTLAERMISPGKWTDPELIGRERADPARRAMVERGRPATGRRDPLGWYLSCGPGKPNEPPPDHGDSMTRRDDQRIAALAKKNAAKVKPPRQEQAADFDPTLRQRAPEQDAETKRLFKEMKRREF
jgi:hypothetical protein